MDEERGIQLKVKIFEILGIVILCTCLMLIAYLMWLAIMIAYHSPFI